MSHQMPGQPAVYAITDIRFAGLARLDAYQGALEVAGNMSVLVIPLLPLNYKGLAELASRMIKMAIGFSSILEGLGVPAQAIGTVHIEIIGEEGRVLANAYSNGQSDALGQVLTRANQ